MHRAPFNAKPSLSRWVAELLPQPLI